MKVGDIVTCINNFLIMGLRLHHTYTITEVSDVDTVRVNNGFTCYYNINRFEPAVKPYDPSQQGDKDDDV